MTRKKLIKVDLIPIVEVVLEIRFTLCTTLDMLHFSSEFFARFNITISSLGNNISLSLISV